MDEFKTKIPMEDDFDSFMRKTESTTTFIPTLDQK